MARAAVTENTKTPTARPNVRHTIGSSRNRFSRGDRLEKAHCTTRNSSEKMMLTSPRTPKPTPISVSVTRLLATVGATVIRGSSSPSPRPATVNNSCTRPARSRRGRSNRPTRAAVRDDELVLDMLRTLRVLPTLHLEAKDARGRLPHPTWMRSGRPHRQHRPHRPHRQHRPHRRHLDADLLAGLPGTIGSVSDEMAAAVLAWKPCGG